MLEIAPAQGISAGYQSSLEFGSDGRRWSHLSSYLAILYAQHIGWFVFKIPQRHQMVHMNLVAGTCSFRNRYVIISISQIDMRIMHFCTMT